MSVISVVIPTVDGRERYLERCIEGYTTRHNTDHNIEIIIEDNHLCGGTAWHLGSEKATGDFIHFTNDDIVPGMDYLEPMIEATDKNYVPVVIVVNTMPHILDENMMPLEDNPLPPTNTWAYEGKPFIPADWYEAPKSDESKYPSLPFCSMDQWQKIGPMICSHYATDKWFGYRSRKAGFKNKVRNQAIFYHYTAQEKREGVIDGWLGHDRLTFDQNFAYPAYKKGELKPDELHPEWNTKKGLKMTRDWYMKNVPRGQGYYWE